MSRTASQMLLSVSKKSSRGKAPSASDRFRVHPQTLMFDNCQTGQVYELDVTVQNVSHRYQKVRIEAPTTGVFRLESSSVFGNLAPGMSLVVSVKAITPDSTRKYCDRLHVVCEDSSVLDIPLVAMPPRAVIEYTGTVNLGDTIQDSVVTTHVDFSNVGQREGTVSLKFPDESPVRLVPSTFTIGAGKKKRVKIEFEGRVLGAAQFLGEVRVEGEGVDKADEYLGLIDVHSNVVESKLELVLPGKGGVCKYMHFDPLHYGSNSKKEAILINNSPLPMTFTSSMSISTKGNKPGVGEDNREGDELHDADLDFEPREGRIAPYSTVPVRFTFRPNPAVQEPKFKSLYDGVPAVVTYDASLVVEAVESKQRIEVKVVGKAVEPTVFIEETEFRFTPCAVFEQKKATFKIHNKVRLLWSLACCLFIFIFLHRVVRWDGMYFTLASNLVITLP